MTLDEKLGQMAQANWHGDNTPQLIREKNIGSVIHSEGPTPGPHVADWTTKVNAYQTEAMKSRLTLSFGVDAVHGQNTFEGAVIFPHNIGMGATGNFELIQRAAEITALETAATGFHWTFSLHATPEHEHWGRVYEGFSEDLELTVKATQASDSGVQTDLARAGKVAATVKHFLGDGATQDGIEGKFVLSESLIRERHLPLIKQPLRRVWLRSWWGSIP